MEIPFMSVYGVYCPLTMQLKFVHYSGLGNEQAAISRFVRSAKFGYNQTQRWVKSLLDKDLQPVVVVFEQAEDFGEAESRRNHWVTHFRGLGYDVQIMPSLRRIERYKPTGKLYLYVLELENGCWYVGVTKNIEQRFKQHLDGIGAGTTKRNKPLAIHELTEIPDGIYEQVEPLEDEKVREYMAKYGVDKVRGGSYIQAKTKGVRKVLRKHGYNELANL